MILYDAEGQPIRFPNMAEWRKHWAADQDNRRPDRYTMDHLDGFEAAVGPDWLYANEALAAATLPTDRLEFVRGEMRQMEGHHKASLRRRITNLGASGQMVLGLWGWDKDPFTVPVERTRMDGGKSVTGTVKVIVKFGRLTDGDLAAVVRWDEAEQAEGDIEHEHFRAGLGLLRKGAQQHDGSLEGFLESLRREGGI
jgi:hypothetical protein